MALSPDATQLSTLLTNLTLPDTQAIRNAEIQIKPLLKHPNCVPALYEILSARGAQVRKIYFLNVFWLTCIMLV
jgi:hypothetical protein